MPPCLDSKAAFTSPVKAADKRTFTRWAKVSLARWECRRDRGERPVL